MVANPMVENAHLKQSPSVIGLKSKILAQCVFLANLLPQKIVATCLQLLSPIHQMAFLTKSTDKFLCNRKAPNSTSNYLRVYLVLFGLGSLNLQGGPLLGINGVMTYITPTNGLINGYLGKFHPYKWTYPYI